MVFCNKCKQDKEESEFWFDKRRGIPHKPCKECANKQKRYRRTLNYVQGCLTKSDLVYHYHTEGLPEEAVDFISSSILLNRAIKSAQKPLIKNFDKFVILFCPSCGKFDKIDLPCDLERMVQVMDRFNQLHISHAIQRT